jgi:hypothetical protein
MKYFYYKLTIYNTEEIWKTCGQKCNYVYKGDDFYEDC